MDPHYSNENIMPVRTEVFVERNLMIHHFSEHVSLPSILNTLQSSITHPQYHPGMNMVWYCETGTKLDLSSDTPLAADDVARKIFDNNGHHYKAALVAEDDLPFGMFRAYEGWSNDRPSVEIKVFRKMDDALSWVDE